MASEAKVGGTSHCTQLLAAMSGEAYRGQPRCGGGSHGPCDGPGVSLAIISGGGGQRLVAVARRVFVVVFFLVFVLFLVVVDLWSWSVSACLESCLASVSA